MSENAPGQAGGDRRRWTSLAKTGGLLAAGVLTGAVLTGAIPAVAESTGGSSTDGSPTSEPTPGTGSDSRQTPGSGRGSDDCPPGGPGRHRGGETAPNQDDGSTPDQQTPTPEQTPSTGQASSGSWRT